MIRKHFRIKRVLLGLALAAFAAPAAQASTGLYVDGPTPGIQSHSVVQAVSTAGSHGFNWNDAGIGASVAFGVALLLLLSVALGRRYYTRSEGSRLAST